MATQIEQLITVISANTAQFTASMQAATAQSQSTASAVTASNRKMSVSFKRLAAGAVGALSAFGAFKGVKGLIETGDTVEQLQLQLTALTGSQRKANVLFGQMEKIASNVVPTFKEVLQGGGRLASVLTPEEIPRFLQLAADMSSTLGLTMQTTADQIARGISSGAGAMEAFRDKGATALIGFDDVVGVTAKEVKAAFEEAMTSTTSTFKGASARMARTWSGTMSMIKDKWFAMQRKVSGSGFFAFIKAGLQVVDRKFGEALAGGSKEMEAFSRALAGAMEIGIDSIANLIDFIGNLKRSWASAKIIWLNFKQSVTSFILEVKTLVGAFKDFFNLENTLDIASTRDDLRGINTELDEVSKQLAALEIAPDLGDPIRKILADIKAQIVQNASVKNKELEQPDRPDREKPLLPEDLDQQTRKANIKRLEDRQKALQAFRDANLSEVENEIFKHERILQVLADANEEGLLTTAEFNELAVSQAQEHTDTLVSMQFEAAEAQSALERAASEERARREKAQFQRRIGFARGFFSSMMQVSKDGSRGLFNVMKVGAAAVAGVNAHRAASDALATTPGPFRYVEAAAAYAAGLAELQAIKGASFGSGGGGSGPSGGGGGGAAQLPASVASPVIPNASTGATLAVEINIGDEDDLVSKRAIRNIIEKINEEIQDGAVIGSFVVS